MKISELIKQLQEIEEKEGDIEVCYTESHEYWGSLETKINYVKVINNAQLDGPKSGKYEKAVRLENY